MKICSKCNKEKEEDQFKFKDKTHTTRRNICRDCTNEYERQRRQKVKGTKCELHIVLNMDEKKMLQEKAKSCNKDMHGYVRDMLLKSKVVRIKESRSYDSLTEKVFQNTAELNAIGININQIAHVLNTYGNEGLTKFARSLTDHMKELIRKQKELEREISKWQ